MSPEFENVLFKTLSLLNAGKICASGPDKFIFQIQIQDSLKRIIMMMMMITAIIIIIIIIIMFVVLIRGICPLVVDRAKATSTGGCQVRINKGGPSRTNGCRRQWGDGSRAGNNQKV